MIARPKAELLSLLRKIPLGFVTTAETLAAAIGVPAPLVVTMLTHLNEEERDLVPWYRVVAKGGGIGRGPHRDLQFAQLVREGVAVSSAGGVQDIARHMLISLDEASLTAAARRAFQTAALTSALQQPVRPAGRSRGMKDRP